MLIDEIIAKNEARLASLQPTLHPKGALSWKEVGLLNLARKKEAKLLQNRHTLRVLKIMAAGGFVQETEQATAVLAGELGIK